MKAELRKRLVISVKRLDEINRLITDPDNPLINRLLDLIEKYGGPDEINKFLMHKLGINNEFKISVFMGNDNPFAVLWTLMAARLFSREDGSTSLNGLNFSNSVNNDTILASHRMRAALKLTENVRFEHHVTETCRSIVRQPYNRREELVEVASEVPNISAKHEGGDPETEMRREHPSDVLDYFLSKEDIERLGFIKCMEQNYLDKHDAMNRTAEALVKAGIGVVCAQNLHDAP